MSFNSDPASLSNQLELAVDFPPVQSKDFIDTLSLAYKAIANAVNGKEGALFSPTESYNFQSWFTAGNPQVYRNCFRKVVDFGSLPNTATKSVAHNIPFGSTYSITRIYAAATNQTGLNYIPIPYASPVAANCIELNADATNVNITTGSNRTAFTVCYVVLEYLKN